MHGKLFSFDKCLTKPNEDFGYFPKTLRKFEEIIGKYGNWMITYGVLSKKKHDINPQVSSIQRGPFSITPVGHGTSLAPPND